MAEEQKCLQCGADLPENAPGGVCPKCVIGLGLPSGANPETPQSPESRSAVPASATPPGGFVPPAPAELAEKLPGLDILELLGQGGMGAVYKARQQQLDRIVALKILPTETSKDPEFAERFTREARSLARLNHPHIVSIYDFGRSDDLCYFIMEFVDGTDLRHVIRAGNLAPDQALGIIPQICEALQYAHEEGIVHRDIKPENIFLDKKGCVKIGDFGLAKILNRRAAEYTLTQTQQRMGTPHYMAPEQIEGASRVDHRADIYSLGVVFYEMLTGELPIGRFAPPSKKIQVDVRLDEIVLHTLEKEPEMRYQHASEVKTEVEDFANRATTPRYEETEHEDVDHSIPSKLPATRSEAVRAYQEKIGIGVAEAGLAVDAVTKKHGQTDQSGSANGELSQVVEAAKQRLRIPAIGLLASGVINCFIAATMLGLAVLGHTGLIIAGITLGSGLIIIGSATAIARLQSYLIALAGSIVAIFSATFLLSLPIGIWTIVMLNSDDVQAAFAERRSSRARTSKRGNPCAVIAVIGLVTIVLTLLTAVGFFLTISPEYNRPKRRGIGSGPGIEASGEKIDDLDFPTGTLRYVEISPDGVVLTAECVETLDLKPSERLAVNNILQNAHRQYFELQDDRTTEQLTGDHLEVTIAPFREEALLFLEKLWADLDGILDTRKRAIARRHLPIGQMFGKFEFGKPTVKITIEKKGEVFHYDISYEWPEGSRKTGGGSTGINSVLPPECQRFWNEARANR